MQADGTRRQRPNSLRNLNTQGCRVRIGHDVGREAGTTDNRPLLIHFLNKYSLNAHYMPGAVLGTGNLHEQIGMPALKELTLYCRIMKVQRNQLGTHCNNPGQDSEH